MDLRIMVIALSAIILANGQPVPVEQSKNVVSGVFIPADTLKNLQTENGATSTGVQNNGRRQGLSIERVNPSRQILQSQTFSDQQPNQQQIVVNQQPRSSQQELVISQQNQPMLDNQQPNQQGVLIQSQPSIVLSQQPSQILVQTPQQNQQQYYIAQNPHGILVNQQPNQGQAVIVSQPGQPQRIIVTQQPNQQGMFINQPNQMLIKNGGPQQVLVSQPNSRPTFFVSQPAQQGVQTILVGRPNQTNGQVGQAVVTVAQPTMTNGNQAIYVRKPNRNHVLYYALNNQGMSNGNTILVPVQQ